MKFSMKTSEAFLRVNFIIFLSISLNAITLHADSKNNDETSTLIYKKKSYQQDRLEIVGDTNFLFFRNQSIQLRNNRIMKILNFDNDFTLKDNIDLNRLINFGNVTNKTGYIKFSNPETNYLEILYNYEIIRNNNKIIIEEKFKIPNIRFSGINEYHFNKQLELVTIIISLDPLLKESLILKKSG